MKTIFYTSALLVILITFCNTKSFCQAGTLDHNFSNNGILTTLVGSKEAEGESVAVQSDGKIIVAGFYFNSAHNNHDVAVVRYNPDGSLDNSFAGNGKAGIDFGSDDYGVTTAIQSDGYIVIAGYAYTHSPEGNYFIATRLKTDGSLDPFFGNNGKIKFPFRGQMKSLAIQGDGKIVAAGDSGISNSKDFALFRFDTNGTFDNSFGIGGKVFTGFSGIDDEGNSVSIQSNGKILVGGSTLRNGEPCFAIARYNSNGSLDASFGGDGKVTTAVGTTGAHAFAIAINSNNKIFQAGEYIDSKGFGQFAIVKYNIDGTLDYSFAGNGKAAVAFNGGSSATSINIQSDGKIVLAGTNTDLNNYDFAIARLHRDGSPDNSFGSGGKITTDFGGSEYGTSSAIQADGKIVIAGLSITDKYKIAVARYLGSGSSFTAIDEENVISEKADDVKAVSLNIKMYPNPVTDIIYVDGLKATAGKVIIRDLTGKLFKKESLVGGLHSFNVNMLKPGAYYLTVEQDGKATNLKFMKR